MTIKQKKSITRILLSGALLIAAALLPLTGVFRLCAFLLPYLIIGGEVLLRAIRNIARGQVFDENFLMALATVGALILGEYPEAVAVMLFYQVGELFESYAVGRSRASIAALMDIRPDHANVERDGVLVMMDPEEVMVGDVIVIKPGERVPLDGRIQSGETSLDTAALTGESLPRDAGVGDEIISGCVNISGLIRAVVTKPYGQSTVSKILDLVENASAKKAKTENFITRFARVYTPAVVIGAVLLALLPPLLLGEPFSVWVYRALTFLVISCPCALVISVPLSFFGGIGGASKSGILIKGSNYMEALARTETVVFDKTGTLTRGVFQVSGVYPEALSNDALLDMAAHCELFSNHPISRSLREASPTPVNPERVSGVKEIPGRGICARVDGKEVYAGNDKLMSEAGVAFQPVLKSGTVVYVAVDGVYAGAIVISDEIKPGAKDAIAGLKRLGIAKTVMLTGDSRVLAQEVGESLGIDEIHGELLPAGKVERVEALLTGRTAEKHVLAFVGDGVNDAPVLSRADVGIAMGGLGSDAAIEAADIVLMDDQLGKLCTAIRISKKTLSIVRQNIVFALGVKFIVLILGAWGIANMWWAVFADVGVSVIAIINAMRALKAR